MSDVIVRETITYVNSMLLEEARAGNVKVVVQVKSVNSEWGLLVLIN